MKMHFPKNTNRSVFLLIMNDILQSFSATWYYILRMAWNYFIS